MRPDTQTNRRFMIVGLPRSGTTYLMTLLNSHPQVYCAGELFNPYAIIDKDSRDTAQLRARNLTPRYFLKEFYAAHEAEPWAKIGFKFMLGHNIRVLTGLLEMPELRDVSLIYVHRNNKLAQVSSLIKANASQNWAQTRKSSHIRQKINADPARISHHWHEYATLDFLFSQWLPTLSQRVISLEYRDLFVENFNARICAFLGLSPNRNMKSPLVKQGSNRIVDRFEHPEVIERFFNKAGLGHWLEDEIG